ncbi:DUF3007 family protein [Myxosarcina sp. GI1]|uniref:DUF3007 family protein n=1 Tax=Myxosarcina sp. GI1 TaxID=1541065 RepID=UPI000568B87C|nr:DUF3007 family protein [Myxosarcina sp. GI1]
MRRIDAIAIAFGIFLTGGIVYLVLQVLGINSVSAGIWTQTLLVVGLLGWCLTYLFRVGTKNMTYNQQLKDYEDAVLQKRLEEMSPEEIERLQTEVEREKENSASSESASE